ncbi:MAG TPA: DinB family protein, partial [Longimicrobium sp.]|nr:DinB family protein [Longimicrobium sp.]
MRVAAVEKHPPRTPGADPRWDDAADEHRAALAAFLDTAEQLRDDAWNAPWAPGKWTRAQVAEHLALTYEIAIRELTTGQGLRVKVTGVRQRLLRWVLMPHILFHRSLPVRVVAPREVRPPEVTVSRAALLRRLRELGVRWEMEMERAIGVGRGGLMHP